jgi:hypothetical protein
MKKVRYAIGAVGIAPALGLMMAPAANAATAATAAPHTAKNAGKTVSLELGRTLLLNCNGVHAATNFNNGMSGAIRYSGSCVRSQEAQIHHSQKGLTERVRFYSIHGTRVRETWQAGNIFRGFTSFHSVPNTRAHEVCEALVANSNHANVKYGPACEFT